MSRPVTPLMDRVFAKVVEGDGGCWVFTGSQWRGYGLINRGTGQGCGRVHRLVYEHLVATVPDGLVLDHLCRNRACCNPEHLDPVTPAVNIQRGAPANRTHCPEGHPYDEANTYRGPRDGKRSCRACRDGRAKARRPAVAEQVPA